MKRKSEEFTYAIEARKTCYQGFYSLQQYDVQLSSFQGRHIRIRRECLDHHQAVCVLPVDFRQKKLVLIEQFRIGAIDHDNPWLIELIAGLIDKDEPVEQVAHREAKEEAGVALGRLYPIMEYYASPGCSNEKLYLFAAEVDSLQAKGVHGLAEEGEDIQVITPSFEQAFNWLEQGLFTNAATILAIQWFRLNQSNLKKQWL